MTTRTQILSGSFSRLDIFEQCKRRAQLAYVDKIPEPDRGQPHDRCPINPVTGEREWHNDRGDRVHKNCEAFIKGEAETLCLEAAKFFSKEIHVLRDRYETGTVTTEETWCFDKDWQLCHTDDYHNIAYRMILDVTERLASTEIVVIDFKTGRRFGNEVKHAKQMQGYAVGCALKFPEVESITTELWYLDQDELAQMHFTRNQALRFLKGLDERNSEMLSTTVFPPNPSEYVCKWCPYSPKQSGDCSVGVVR